MSIDERVLGTGTPSINGKRCEMKGVSGWHYRPYVPMERSTERNAPSICRLAPFETGTEVETLDADAPDATHLLNIRPRDQGDGEPWLAVKMDGRTAVLDGLLPRTDYELFVSRVAEPSTRSRARLIRTGAYPDRVVNYVHPNDDVYAFSGRYLCSPTLTRTPSGDLLAAMDLFEHGGPQNLTLLFRSDDGGRNWEYLCDLFPAYWGALFMNHGVLYFLGTNTENGHVLIGASYDEGCSWTKPTMLFVGGGGRETCGYQRQPVPIIEHEGTLITSVDYGSHTSPSRYGVGTMSVSADADLLDPTNWTVSDLTYFDRGWPGSPTGGTVSMHEGSVYVAGDGRLVNLVRMEIRDADPSYGKACLLELDPNNLEAAPKFLKIADMPTGSNSRTHVLKDPESGRYWAIGNLVTDDTTPRMRNVLCLCVSNDGYEWHVAKTLLDYHQLDPADVGFQYTSFIIDGDDILYLTRTAINGAHNFHDANCQTFGVVSDFRSL